MSARYRVIPQERILDEMLLHIWPYEARSRPAEIKAMAETVLARWVALGLQFHEKDGAQLFDKCEVHNFCRLLGLDGRDTTWQRLNVQTIRQHVCDFAPGLDVDRTRALPGPTRFGVNLLRSVNLEHLQAGRALRLGMLLPSEGPGQRQVRIEAFAPPGCRLAQADGHMDIRTTVGDTRLLTFGCRVEFTGSWQTFSLDARLLRSELPPDAETFLSRRDGMVVITPFVENLARDLARGSPNPLETLRRFWAFTFERLKISFIHHDDLDPEDPLKSVLELGWADCYVGSSLVVGLCRAVGIPARMVHGILLYPAAPGLHFWLEVWFAPYGWIPLDLLSWTLAEGQLAQEVWSNWFFGRSDYRLKLEHYPNSRVAGRLGVRFPKNWYRSETLSEKGTNTGYFEPENGRLIYNDRIEVERLTGVSTR